MFDRCRFWRRQLSHLADGVLPMAKLGALENHLARCPRCRAAQEADNVLRAGCRRHTGLLDSDFAARFDNQVMAALRVAPTVPSYIRGRDWLRPAQACWSALPFDFLRQIAGGAVVAAGVTALLLLPALRPSGKTAQRGAAHLSTALNDARRDDAPVPLESLLHSPSPRAALLWTAPRVRTHHLPWRVKTPITPTTLEVKG